MPRQCLALPASATLILGLLLAGCTGEVAPDPVPPTQTQTQMPEPVATAPLECADLASEDAVAAALTGSDGVTPTPVVAVQPSRAFDFALLNNSGGLGCSWRVGEGQLYIGGGYGDWAYLAIEVLAGAAAQWTPPYLGDTQSTEHIDVAGVTATTAGGGETGWTISAPVGDAWVQITVKSSGMASGATRFAGAAFNRVLDQMMPAAMQAITVVQNAGAVGLSWPELVPREGEARCDGGLAQQGIASALLLNDASGVSYETVDARDKEVDGLSDAVNAVAGVFTCELFAEGLGQTTITVVRNYGSTIEMIGSLADSAASVEAVVLEGAVDGEAAYLSLREDGPRAPVYFTLGKTLYRVYSDGATSVAEAIIAQTR